MDVRRNVEGVRDLGGAVKTAAMMRVEQQSRYGCTDEVFAHDEQ